MGFFQKFPYTDDHQLNLDWILRLFTSFKGGSINQVLAKRSNKDYDFKWVNQGGGGSSDYNDLSNKPSINSVELSGNKTLAQLGINIPSAGTGTPAMNGTGSAGSSSNYARADHVHPTDTSRAAASSVHSIPSGGSTGQVLAKASNTNYDAEWITPPGDSVNSVNGQTGTVVLDAGDVGALPDSYTPPAEVAWFTYGTSSSAEIETAYQAGKVCIATNPNDTRVYILSDRISATDHIFTAGTATRLYNIECNNGTWTSGSRLIPASASTTPAALGTASAGSASTVSRSDHVHPMPNASEIGAVSSNQGIDNAGKFLVVGADGIVTLTTLP